MRTVCVMCGCALVCADDHDDSNACCLDCRLRNFAGQSVPDPELDPTPHMPAMLGDVVLLLGLLAFGVCLAAVYVCLWRD